MKLTVNIQQKDLEEHYTSIWKKTGKGSLADYIFEVVVWAVLGFVYVYFFRPINTSHVVLFMTMLVATSFTEWYRARKLRLKVVNDEANPALGTQNLTFEEKGITYSNDLSDGNILWPGILRIEETDNLFQFFIGTFEAILIPKQSVENVDEFRSFIGDLRKNIEAPPV